MADVVVNGRPYRDATHVVLTESGLGYHRVEWPGKTACGLASTHLAQLGLRPGWWPDAPCGTCFPPAEGGP